MTSNVLNLGAKADHVTDDVPAIQAAIDVCSKAGGGRVVLEGGKHFYSGSIILKENVDLHLGWGAVLQARKALERYFHPNAGQRDDGVERVGIPVILKPSYVFIYVKGANNIAISGEGVIDGNTYAFVRQMSPYYVTSDFYPCLTLAYTEHYNHISFKDVIIRNAPFWTLHPAGCDDVLISGLRISNDLNVASSDGVDSDHFINVRIIGCHVTCADDCICLKSSSGDTEYGSLESVIISGCILTSTSAALKIGIEGTGDFKNVAVDNCIISDGNRGTSIQIRDGGNARNVSSSNTIVETRRFAECWWGYVEPITISTHDRDRHTKSGRISNIWFPSIACDSRNGVLLSGSRGNHTEDTLLEDVRVVARVKSKWPRGMYDLCPGYGQRIEETKTFGFYIRRAGHVILRNCQVKSGGEEKNDFSHALCAEERRDMTLKNSRGQVVSSSLENVVIRQDKS